jgi:hypothetical protein
MIRSVRMRLRGQFAHRDFVLQNRSEGNEFASSKQFRQARLHLLNVAVMTQTRLQRSCDSRLLRIYFPWVQVNKDWAMVRFDNTANRPSVEPHGQVAKGTSAASGKIAAKYPHRHWRNFIKGLRAIDLPAEREPRCGRNSVQVVEYRKHARIVDETFFGEDWYCPEGFTNDGKSRGTIGGRSFAAGICDCRCRTLRVGAKFVRGEAMEPAMEETMAADFMAGAANLTDEFRATLCNPPQDKERSVRVKSREKFEKPASIVDNAAGKVRPGLRSHLACEGFNMKVVFYVYAEAVQLRSGHRVSILAMLHLWGTRDGGRSR